MVDLDAHEIPCASYIHPLPLQLGLQWADQGVTPVAMANPNPPGVSCIRIHANFALMISGRDFRGFVVRIIVNNHTLP